MIGILIFDLGNVLLSFKPSDFLTRQKINGSQKEMILSDIFGSKEWLLLDNGDLDVEEAIESISERSLLGREEISRIFSLRTSMLDPIEKNVSLLPFLVKRGYRLYFLSNFPIDIFDEVRAMNPFFGYFEGGIISAEARISKPDPGIYKLLLSRHEINAADSLFIDDSEENVRAAEEAGLHGYHTGGSTDIKDSLEEILALKGKY